MMYNCKITAKLFKQIFALKNNLSCLQQNTFQIVNLVDTVGGRMEEIGIKIFISLEL